MVYRLSSICRVAACAMAALASIDLTLAAEVRDVEQHRHANDVGRASDRDDEYYRSSRGGKIVGIYREMKVKLDNSEYMRKRSPQNGAEEDETVTISKEMTAKTAKKSEVTAKAAKASVSTAKTATPKGTDYPTYSPTTTLFPTTTSHPSYPTNFPSYSPTATKAAKGTTDAATAAKAAKEPTTAKAGKGV
jgi:hypothetical protein